MNQNQPSTLQHLARKLRLFALAATAFAALSAQAAAPANDDIANALIITEPLPFTHSVSTTDATVASDPVGCYAVTHTVWFSYTPTTTGYVVVDTFGSDYDTVLEIFHGSPEDLYSYYECSDDTGDGAQAGLVLWVNAEETIYIMAGSGNGSPGGNLVLHVNPPPTPPVVTMSVVEPVQFNPANGAAHVRLRIESSAPFTPAVAFATIIQPNGRGDIAGTEIAYVYQTGTSFEVAIPAIFNIGNDRSHGTGFKGGPARLIAAFAYYYGPGYSFFGRVQLDQAINLKAAPRK